RKPLARRRQFHRRTYLRRCDALLRQDRGSRCPSCPFRRYASGRQRPSQSGAPWPSACPRDQLGQPHQIVGGDSEGKSPCDTIAATEAGLLLPGDRLENSTALARPWSKPPPAPWIDSSGMPTPFSAYSINPASVSATR